MPLPRPEPLTTVHPLDGFDCGKPALNAWLVRYARQAQASGSARTFVVQDGMRVLGYYSLSVGQVDAIETPERVRKGMGNYPIPVILLARLAVDRRCQGQGIGTGLLKDAIRHTCLIAEQAGVRALLVHPLDDAATRFYSEFGFEPSPLRERQLLLLLKDARRYIAAESS
jgi:predicted N-acetyltransferase YhbS